MRSTVGPDSAMTQKHRVVFQENQISFCSSGLLILAVVENPVLAAPRFRLAQFNKLVHSPFNLNPVRTILNRAKAYPFLLQDPEPQSFEPPCNRPNPITPKPCRQGHKKEHARTKRTSASSSRRGSSTRVTHLGIEKLWRSTEPSCRERLSYVEQGGEQIATKEIGIRVASVTALAASLVLVWAPLPSTGGESSALRKVQLEGPDK